jgi:tetratricopeptide (TPR) repeat protein
MRLTNAATQAMLLGDLDGALEFLNRAIRVDSTATEAIYLRSRIQLERGEPEAAAEGFCQYLRMDPQGASAREAATRLEEAAGQGVGGELFAAFARGVAMYGQGDVEAAEQAFDSVVEARPGAADALFNRGLMRVLLDRPGPAAADLERYVTLEPDGPNADLVREYLAVLASMEGPGAGRALVAGVVIPGAGQFYTRRPGLGAAVLGIAAGTIAGGYFHERTTIRCRIANPEGDCPTEDIASTVTERPYLGVAIGVAAGVAIAAAIEASLYASRVGRERYERPVTSAFLSGVQRLGFDRGGVSLQVLHYTF